MVSGGTDKNGGPKIPSPCPRPGIRRVPSPACHAVGEDCPGYGKRDGPRAGKGVRMDDEVRRSMARIGEATDRLLASAAALTDASAGEPSLLPGWTRGHVLTHVARNGDGLGNLLRWARTGTETPMYASREARRADIEAGAGRSAADLAADVQATAIAFAAEAASLPGEAWAAQVQMLVGPPMPARRVLDWRLREVEIHHVDLAAGYRPADWPAEFVTASLPEVAGVVRGPGGRAVLPAPARRLRPRGQLQDRPGAARHAAAARARAAGHPAGLADRPGRRQRPAGLRRRRRSAGAAPVAVGGRPRRVS